MARQVGPAIAQAADVQRSRMLAHDKATGLPSLDQFLDLTTAQVAEATDSRPVCVLLTHVVDLDRVIRAFGRSTADDLLARIIGATRRSLRGADVLFRYRSTEFVAMLLQTSDATGRAIASRVIQSVTDEQSTLDASYRVHVSISVVTAPQDGGSLEELLQKAARQIRSGRTDNDQDGGTPRTSIH